MQRSTFLVTFLVSQCLLYGNSTDSTRLKHKFGKAIQLKYSQPDSATVEFSRILPLYVKAKDTLMLAHTYSELISLYSGNGEYNTAYDHIWKVLPYIESPKYLEQKVQILNKLISFYMVFDQHYRAKKTYRQVQELIKKVVGKEN